MYLLYSGISVLQPCLKYRNYDKEHGKKQLKKSTVHIIYMISLGFPSYIVKKPLNLLKKRLNLHKFYHSLHFTHFLISVKYVIHN